MGELDRIAVPSLGNKSSVKDPELCRETYRQELSTEKPEDEVLYLPIFHLHTHPCHRSFPSENDLVNATQRYETEISLGPRRARVRNPTINVINDNSKGVGFGNRMHGDSQFFYQFNGDFQAYERFMNEYKRNLETAYKKDGRCPEGHFAQQMAKSGAFKAIAYPKGSLFVPLKTENAVLHRVKKQAMRTLGEKFAYDITVRRMF